MTEPIYAKDGRVHIRICDGWGEDHEDCTLDEAKAYAAQLAAAIAECEPMAEAIKAACADGHDWGSGINGYRAWDHSQPVTIRWCNRSGCDASETLDGWAHFAGRLHICPITGQQLACYGPGCEHCSEEAFGQAMRQMLAEAAKRITEAEEAAP